MTLYKSYDIVQKLVRTLLNSKHEKTHNSSTTVESDVVVEDPSSMLFCMKGGPIQSMPLPIVAHQRNHLKVEVINGIPYVKQQNVYMEDFC